MSDVQNAIEACIREHCKKIAADKPHLIQPLAAHVVTMHENALDAVGYQIDADQITEAMETIKVGLMKVAALSESVQIKLNQSTPLLKSEKKQQFGTEEYFADLFSKPGQKTATIPPNGPPNPRANLAVFNARIEAMETLIDGLIEVEIEQHAKKEKHSRRNLHGPAVVAACRKVWREELGGDVRNPTKKTEPPKQIRNNTSPDIAEFIAAVFDKLDVGMDVRSAFKSLETLGGEEALMLNLKR